MSIQHEVHHFKSTINEFILLLLNTITFFFTLFINANSSWFTGRDIGDISNQFNTLITPAGYAFAIWGLIYLLLLGFIGFQWYQWIVNKNGALIKQIGSWFILTNIANMSWVIVWVYEWTGLSVCVMFLLLGCLFQLVFRLRLEIWDAPVREILFVWWPICIYAAWIVLASVVNTSAFLVSIQWEGKPLSPSSWAILMIVISTLLYLFLTFNRNMREAALVGIWGIMAIAARHSEDYQHLKYTIYLASAVLLIAATYHAWINRSTSPLAKWRKGEW